MTIFQSNTCEIPHCNNEAIPKKSRCTKCLERYDSQNKAFVVYCDFWKYTPVERKKNGLTQSDITLWVYDGYVQKAPLFVAQLEGKHIGEVDHILSVQSKYLLMGIEPAML